jgi:NADPH-dependent curcumin reductase CurA
MPTDIPTYSTPAENRQVLLTSRPAGVPQAGDFTLASSPVPRPGPGEFLVRTIYLSVDPAQRGWASSEANYSAPVPLGGPMRALAVAVVVESRHPDFTEGQFLYGWFGWQDYAVATPQQVILRATQELPLTAFGSLLGINGITAYLGLTELGRPKPGDTLVVSTAAGSVGSFVGQIGRSLGCRCIGLTGDDRKVALCKERYGYEVALNYKTGGLDEAMAAAAPDGVNVYFDNTGGAILDTVLRRMAVAGRIVQCGTASIGSWNPPPSGPRNEREILTRRLVWSGFVIFDHMARYGQAADELAQLCRAGTLSFDTDLAEGIEQAPGAIASLYAGENLGKKLIYVG